MSGILKKILTTTRQDLEERKKILPLEELKASVAPRQPGTFRSALGAAGISLIAEIKRASPSRGDIRPGLKVPEMVKAYEEGGARAISVLTEERHFKGSLADLREARSATSLPLLRKDFIVDPYQVWEAAGAGADAVLLIVAALTPDSLKGLACEASVAGLDTLVEVHTKGELETALAANAAVIGINNRDLSTFEVKLQTTIDLMESVPDGVLAVSESGIKTREDVLRLDQARVDAILVGETLAASSNPGSKIKELTGNNIKA